MRVLFLTLYPETAASARYRVHQFLPYLRDCGVECTVQSAVSESVFAKHTGPNRKGRAAWYHLAETPRRIAQLLGARDYDVVFVQKALMSASVHGLSALLETRARRVVYDIDDAVFLAPPHALRGPWRSIEDHDQIARLLARAHLVLAGNSWLAESIGANSTLWPTVVDTERFCPNGQHDGAFRVGWIGSPSTTPALSEISDVLDSLRDAELCLIGADSSRVTFDRATIAPWGYASEVDDIRRFTVGIMPLVRNEWSRGKCALKALQYMACGVPCIATRFGAATEVIEHGVNGFLADSPEEWRAAFDALRDPGMRNRIAEAGRVTVVDRYSLCTAAPRLHELLESVA